MLCSFHENIIELSSISSSLDLDSYKNCKVSFAPEQFNAVRLIGIIAIYYSFLHCYFEYSRNTETIPNVFRFISLRSVFLWKMNGLFSIFKWSRLEYATLLCKCNWHYKRNPYKIVLLNLLFFFQCYSTHFFIYVAKVANAKLCVEEK